jgi:hypothetical protein
MKLADKKLLAILTIAFLLVSMGALTLISTTSAHTPAWNIRTFAYIKAAPDPVGVGQKVNVIMWVDKVISGAAIPNDIRFHNYKLVITDPNGETQEETFAVVQDTTSAQYYSFTPTKTGTYNLTFYFPQQTYTWTTPLSSFFGPPTPNENTNDTYLASNATTTVTVQDEQVTAITSYPLPTEYWTRPIYGENTDWWVISSNWLGTGAPGFSGGTVTGYVDDAIGSKTSHVMWTKSLQFGGVVGGNEYEVQGDTFFEGSAYINRYTNPIIISGNIYYSEPLGFSSGTGRQTVCVNLRTGELVWARQDIPEPSFALIPNVPTGDPNQHGVFPPILVVSSGGYNFFTGTFDPTKWEMYDAFTGDWLYEANDVPSGTMTLGPNGEMLIYNLQNNNFTNPKYYLGEWNSTKLMYSSAGGFGLSPIGTGTIIDAGASSMYDWNVSVSSLNTLNPSASVVVAYAQDIMLLRSGSLPSGGFSMFAAVSSAPYTYLALNLNATNDQGLGAQLWKQTYNAPTGDDVNVTVFEGGSSAVSRVFVQTYKETGKWVGFSLDSGDQIWGPTFSQTAINPLDYYGNQFSGASIAQIAYGNMYTSEFGGILYCYDALTGDLKWTYGNGGVPGNDTNAGFYSPRGNYPTFIAAIGNGIIYLETTEHTVTTPIYKGAMARAVNATDGTELWTLSSYIGGGQAGSSYAIADGFNTWFNGYSNEIYTVGRGPSQTTVQAGPKSTVLGNSVVIEGSVTDIASGTLQDEQAARFPNGVPVASDDSMTDWMGYVYQQRPLPEDFVGVDVMIIALDANNNYQLLGTATTDNTGHYSLQYTPTIEGKFTITATFAGTNGYWPSKATTTFAVDPAAATPAPVETQPPGAADQYFVPAVAGISVLIIVCFAITILVLRKRP